MSTPTQPLWYRLTPEQIRAKPFTRTPMGRRGLSEDEVGHFMLRLADEVAALHQDLAGLRAENDRLRDFYRNRGEHASDRDGPAPGQQAILEAVNLLSQAQLHADSLIAQARDHARQAAEQARRYYHEVLREAQRQALAEAERAAREHRDRADARHAAELDRLQRRLDESRALLDALQAAEGQLGAAREALAGHLDRLADDGTASRPPEPSDRPPGQASEELPAGTAAPRAAPDADSSDGVSAWSGLQ
ncbi:DivIVA domain-containing protein [Streptomyces sp. NPDC001288]|uniref:DivIVA domain-containing protein n=1 Tax=Streptomyces sp. NPDC001297 TaxID=3364559 RepID=UPI0036ABF368